MLTDKEISENPYNPCYQCSKKDDNRIWKCENWEILNES